MYETKLLRNVIIIRIVIFCWKYYAVRTVLLVYDLRSQTVYIADNMVYFPTA